MPLIQLVVILILVGLGLWLINRYVPMAEPIKTILNVVVVLVVLLWLLGIFGFGDFYVGPRR